MSVQRMGHGSCPGSGVVLMQDERTNRYGFSHMQVSQAMTKANRHRYPVERRFGHLNPRQPAVRGCGMVPATSDMKQLPELRLPPPEPGAHIEEERDDG